MPIQQSAGAEIKGLLEALGDADETTHEAAIARLAVIGPRVVERLLSGFPSAAGRARAGMLRVLDALADPRALAVARPALEDPSALVQTAAIGALRALLSAGNAAAAHDAFDALVSVALDPRRIAPVRLVAWDAIRESMGDARAAIQATLAADPDPAVRAAAGRTTASTGSGSDVWHAAIEGHLPASAEALKAALSAHKTTARLTELQRLVDQLRARELQEPDAAVREQWRTVRGAVHQALAVRNSRLALYDLRDSFLTSERLPVAFLAAIEEIGDASCLDALAAAYEESSRSGDAWWREHLATAFRAIVHRENLTRRHAVVKRVLARWSQAGELLR